MFSLSLLFVPVRVHFSPCCRGGHDPRIGGLVIGPSGVKRRLESRVVEIKIEFRSLLGATGKATNLNKAIVYLRILVF